MAVDENIKEIKDRLLQYIALVKSIRSIRKNLIAKQITLLQAKKQLKQEELQYFKNSFSSI